MKKTIILLIVICLLFFSACNTTKINNASLSANGENSHQYLTGTELSYQSDWLKTGLSKVGLKNLSIGETVEGSTITNLSTENSPFAMYILCDYDRYGNSVYHDSYLAVETNSKILFKDLATDNYIGSYGDILYACDIDGDGTDEIIIQQTVGVSGGAGQYLSRVFKVSENDIFEIFNSSTFDLFDTGFTGVLKNDFKLEIQNKFTGYTTIIDFSEKKQYVGVYFDETGKVICDANIWCDSYKEFIPKDVNNDGVFEIVCLQYISLYGHSDHIGDAKSILYFNTQTQKFEIVQSEFLPAE